MKREGRDEGARRWAVLSVGWVVLCSLVLGLFGTLVAQHAWAEETPTTVDELLKVYGVADLPADYVVIIDTSGSMEDPKNPIYPEVRAAYASFVDAISERDHLSLVTFDSTATLRFSGKPAGAGRGEAKTALPTRARGAGTNIGAGLQVAIDQLGRADANRVQIVVFLTDGQPTVKTNYAALAALAAKATQGRQVRAIGASLGTQEQTGAALLETVFPGKTQVVKLPNDQIKGFFQDAIKRARIAQLHDPIRDEIRDGAVQVSATPSELGGEMKFEVRLTNQYGHLGARIGVEEILVSDNQGRELHSVLEGGRRTIVLAPGATSEALIVRVETGVSPAPIRIGTETEREFFRVAMRGTVRVEPSDVIYSNLGLDTGGKVAQTAQVPAERTLGIAYWMIAAAFAAVALLVFILVRIHLRFFATPKLWGVLTTGESTYPLRGRTMAIGGKHTPSPPGCGDLVVEFLTKRGKFYKGRPMVFVRSKTPGVELKKGHSRSALTSTPSHLTAGTTLQVSLAHVTFLARSPKK